MRRVACLLLFACLLSLLAAPALAAPQDRRVALVIGNGAYKDAPLKNPVNDARDMSAALKGLGFEVILRENASLRQMEDALDQFWASIRQGGTGLFFFAGHGLQVKGVNYLVPVDARIVVEQDAKSTCMDAGRVLGRMENAGNGLNIILLDACRNNPFARSWRSADAGLAKMDAPTGTLIGYATAPDSVAADGTGKNGVYTQHLLEQMRVPGQGIETMLKRVRIGVLQDTERRQTPWESSSLTGDFYFNRQSAPTVQLAPLQALAPKFDAKAEKQRLAEETARLKREKDELAQMQAIQAEKDRLDAERQRVEQAKLLAMAPRPKSAPQAADAAARLVGTFAEHMPEYGKNNGLFFEFVLKGGRLVGTTSGWTGGVTPVEVGNVRIEGGALRFRFTYKKGLMGMGGTTYTDYVCDISGDLDRLPAAYTTESGMRGRHELVRVADARPSSASAHAAQFAQLARAGLPDARAHFQRAVQANPNDAEARAGLAIALYFGGEDGDAKYQVQRLSESGAETSGARLARGLMLAVEGKDEAAYQFSRAADEGADRALALLCQTVAAERRADFDGGLGRLHEYAALVPDGERGALYRQLERAMDLKGRLAGRYAIAWGNKANPSPMVLEFFVRDGQLAGSAGGATEHMRLVSITNIQLKGRTLSFQCDFRVGLLLLGGSALTYYYSAELGRDLSFIQVKATMGSGKGGEDLLVRLPDAR